METTFSMTRVQHIMRRDLIENWKSNLYGLLGIFAACFFPMLGFLWSAERWTEEGYPEVYSFERFCGNMLGIISMVVSVAMIYYASRIMKCMDNKRKTYFLFIAASYEIGEVLLSCFVRDSRHCVDDSGCLAGFGTYPLSVVAFV